jgi:hypothetical protein
MRDIAARYVTEVVIYHAETVRAGGIHPEIALLQKRTAGLDSRIETSTIRASGVIRNIPTIPTALVVLICGLRKIGSSSSVVETFAR